MVGGISVGDADGQGDLVLFSHLLGIPCIRFIVGGISDEEGIVRHVLLLGGAGLARDRIFPEHIEGGVAGGHTAHAPVDAVPLVCLQVNGVADVVVTDGFTGNAVLKSIVGTAMNMMNLLKSAILNEGIKGKMGAMLLKDGLRSLKAEMDYSKHGGAVLFGLKAPVIKTHGATGPDAVRYTIRQIHTMLETDVVGQLVEQFEKSEE